MSQELPRMSLEQPTPVDTSAGTTDSRIGPDGKITIQQGEYLKAKALTNAATSLVKRARNLGGRGAVGSNGDFYQFQVYSDSELGATGLSTWRSEAETGRIKQTYTAIDNLGAHFEDRTHFHNNSTKDNLIHEASVNQPKANGGIDSRGVTGGRLNSSRTTYSGDEERAAIETAKNVIKEQQYVLAAAKRVVNVEDQPDKAA